MMLSLEMFKNESGAMRKLKEERNKEQQMINRLIKNEVIDMADRMERLEQMISSQTNLMTNVSSRLEEIMESSEATTETYSGEMSIYSDASDGHVSTRSKREVRNMFELPVFSHKETSLSR
mmetsp:Transcript_14348/g.22316  ORF Transcript_14348/g.22316 Transcript_14348/m.22316 type:complete len:121 (+) Transcript_14348:443-805(+)